MMRNTNLSKHLGRWILLSLFAILSTGAAAETGGLKWKLRSSAYANCLCLGETIAFHPESDLPADIVRVTGTVRDSNGNRVCEKKIPIGEFKKEGWRWKAAESGFYTLVFTLKDKDGKEHQAYDSFLKKAYRYIGPKAKLIDQEEFKRNEINVAVFPSPVRTPDRIPAQIGVSLSWKIYRIKDPAELLKLANILGFHFIRIHPLFWAKIETAPHQYSWDKLDAFLDCAKKMGYREFTGDVFGTPRWASTNPKEEVRGIWAYLAYPPKKMKDWTDFLEAVVKRYPFIKDWELWNEPHLPGQSVFWHESPEKFVELLKAGYETVKRVQPESRVQLGGIGMRYLPFYDRIIRDGAGKYFDVLPLHLGWGQEAPYIKPFNAIDRKYGVEPKPWITGEWHSVLVGAEDIPLPSEKQIAINMVLSFADQIKDGAGKITFYGVTPGTNETETLKFLAKNKLPAQAACIFRGAPALEPRFAAVVWRNLIDLFSGPKIEYLGGYSLKDGKQSAVHMKSDAGSVAIVWNNENRETPISRELAKIITKDSVVTTWEGKKIDSSSPEAIRLRPECLYYIKNPDAAVMEKWHRNPRVLFRQKGTAEIRHDVLGGYRDGRIFDDGMNILSPESLIWLSCSAYVPMNGKKAKADGFGAKFAVGLSEAGMDLLAVAHDKVHHQTGSGKDLWQGDGIQFAIDAERKGRQTDRLEFQAGLTPAGAVVWKETAPAIRGDVPDRYSAPKSFAKYGKIRIGRNGGITTYRIHVSKDDLYPFAFLKGDPLRFSLLVNNNDGKGREGYLRWADGIGLMKNPGEYGDLTRPAASKTVVSRKDMNKVWGAAQNISGDGPLAETKMKIESLGAKKQNAAGVASPVVRAVPGIPYRFSGKVRGNVSIYVMATLHSGKSKKRLDLVEKTRLDTDKWKTIEKVFIMPAGTEKMQLNVFCWKEDGWFELGDFKLSCGTSSPLSFGQSKNRSGE